MFCRYYLPMHEASPLRIAGATAHTATDSALQTANGEDRDPLASLNGAAGRLFEWESSGHLLTRADIERYSRQLILPALGVPGELSSLILTLEYSRAFRGGAAVSTAGGAAVIACAFECSGVVLLHATSLPERTLVAGCAGQERLKAASVLVIGAGGLGSPAILYLAAAGIGQLGIVDR